MEDTKQRILEKSLELFSTKGYDAVSVGEIAKAVGIKDCISILLKADTKLMQLLNMKKHLFA